MAFEQFISRARRKPLLVPGQTTREVSLGRAEIQRMLPHRDPMLLVDLVNRVDLEQEALEARRRIDPADPVLKGHFPAHPVYPGALLVEAMGQASLCLNHLLAAGRVEVLPDDQPLPVRLLRIHHALFQAEVRPGDELVLMAKKIEDDSFTLTCGAQAMVDGKVCAVTLMDVFLAADD
jgi:3-hydroxymyristoyl/3-hydroxydecanoyl-(acyl carrier protein) dehydratase